MKNFFSILLMLFTLSYGGRTLSQDFWHQTNGPYGGASVKDFLQYDDSTIYIATTEGLVKSSDNGISWNRIDTFSNVTCLGTDKLNTLYFGISGHLKRSTDGGNSWIDIEVWGAAITDFIIPYRDTIFVGSGENGVFRSLDYGETWEQINNGIEYSAVYELVLLSNGELLVGSNGGGVYKSTNWGESWSESNNGIPVNSMGYRHAESFCETSPGEIFTGTHNGIYFSSNYGNNWMFRSNGCATYDAQCIDQDESGNLFAGTDLNGGVYWSTNGGNLWTHLGLGYSIYTLGWDFNSRLYAGGSSQGLNRYIPEDTTWVQVYNRGYTPIEVTLISQADNGNLVASTKWWGVYISTNQGQLWEGTNYNGYEFEHLEFVSDSIIIGGNLSGLYVSTDIGQTWAITSGRRVTSLYYDKQSKLVYFGAHDDTCGIYVSYDFGQNWQILAAIQVTWIIQWVNALHITSQNNYILASVLYADYFSQIFKFYRSTNVGVSWELIAQDPYRLVFDIEEDNSRNLYALNGLQLFVSYDEGDNWITRNTPNSNSMSFDYSERIYLPYYSSFHFSTDEGITWLEMDRSGLGNSDINDITINKNNRIYLATENGVFIGEADSIVLSTLSEIETQKSFVISQNYPNPFNPSTTIKYQIPQLSFVTLKVYDVLGNEIATLINEEKPAGSYEVEFDGTGLPSGIYLYQLSAGDPSTGSGQGFVEAKKMILLK